MRNTCGSFPSPSHTPQTTPLHTQTNTHAHTRAHTRARTHRTHARTITDAVTTTTDDWAWLLLAHFATGLDGPIRSQANAARTDKTIWLHGGMTSSMWCWRCPCSLASLLVPPLRYNCSTPMLYARSFCLPQCAHPLPEPAECAAKSWDSPPRRCSGEPPLRVSMRCIGRNRRHEFTLVPSQAGGTPSAFHPMRRCQRHVLGRPCTAATYHIPDNN